MGAGSPQAQRVQIERQADLAHKRSLARRLAGITTPEAADTPATDRSPDRAARGGARHHCAALGPGRAASGCHGHLERHGVTRRQVGISRSDRSDDAAAGGGLRPRHRRDVDVSGNRHAPRGAAVSASLVTRTSTVCPDPNRRQPGSPTPTGPRWPAVRTVRAGRAAGRSRGHGARRSRHRGAGGRAQGRWSGAAICRWTVSVAPVSNAWSFDRVSERPSCTEMAPEMSVTRCRKGTLTCQFGRADPLSFLTWSSTVSGSSESTCQDRMTPWSPWAAVVGRRPPSSARRTTPSSRFTDILLVWWLCGI